MLDFVLRDWELLGFCRSATSPADSGELSVGNSRGPSHTALAFFQPVLMAACKKPWAGRRESSLS